MPRIAQAADDDARELEAPDVIKVFEEHAHIPPSEALIAQILEFTSSSAVRGLARKDIKQNLAPSEMIAKVGGGVVQIIDAAPQARRELQDLLGLKTPDPTDATATELRAAINALDNLVAGAEKATVYFPPPRRRNQFTRWHYVADHLLECVGLALRQAGVCPVPSAKSMASSRVKIVEALLHRLGFAEATPAAIANRAQTSPTARARQEIIAGGKAKRGAAERTPE